MRHQVMIIIYIKWYTMSSTFWDI